MDNNDLIRRGATAKDLRAYAERKAQVNGIEYANGILAAACRIEQSIPAVDAVEVVRCRECRFNTTEKKCLNSDSIIRIPSDNDFCSYGQRREDGDGDG